MDYKNEIPIVFTGTSTELSAKFNEPIKLNNNQIGLQMISSAYNISNVSNANNRFKFKIGEEEWRNGAIPKGSYEISDIERAIEVIMKSNDENTNDLTKNSFDDKILISIDKGTGKSIITVPKNVILDLKDYSEYGENVESVGSMLGIRTELDSGIHVSHDIIRIEPITCLFVHCNIVRGGYLNGKPFQSIYQFLPNVNLGESFFKEPYRISFHEIPNSFFEISEIKVWLTDQNNNHVDMNEEEITIVLLLR